MFSIELLQAISNWQKGGDLKQKTKRGLALKEVSNDLPAQYKMVDSTCYRQISLEKSSLWYIGKEYHLNETISSWTTSFEVSKEFKGGVPPIGYQGVIFKIEPEMIDQSVINLEILFKCEKFQEFLNSNISRIHDYHNGIGRYANSQKEIVIEVEKLPLESLIAWGGYTSSMKELADMYFNHEVNIMEEKEFQVLMEKAGIQCGGCWLTTSDAVKRISERLMYHTKNLSEMS